MESLLSVSFDNIASRDLNKTRKGLRQVEGLLAQICLSPSSAGAGLSPPKKKRTSVVLAVDQPLSSNDHEDQCSRRLSIVAEDLAFLEFFRLQESFEWNVTIRLVECLERLLGLRSNSQINQYIVSTLDLLHGMLLLHPKSRSLFGREMHLTLFLDLLDPDNPPSVLSSAVTALLSALIDSPRNIRLFEAMDGIPTIATLLQSHTIDQEVHKRLAEFLSFYVMREGPAGLDDAESSVDGGSSMVVMDGSAIKRAGINTARSWGSNTSSEQDVELKNPQTKLALLEKHMQHKQLDGMGVHGLGNDEMAIFSLTV